MGASGSGPPQPYVRPEDDDVEEDYYEEDEKPHDWLEGHTAIKFLMAGGIAGAGKCSFILKCASFTPIQCHEHAPLLLIG